MAVKIPPDVKILKLSARERGENILFASTLCFYHFSSKAFGG
jgi:hypothetical protein